MNKPLQTVLAISLAVSLAVIANDALAGTKHNLDASTADLTSADLSAPAEAIAYTCYDIGTYTSEILDTILLAPIAPLGGYVPTAGDTLEELCYSLYTYSTGEE